jgi:hypothetical protein
MGLSAAQDGWTWNARLAEPLPQEDSLESLLALAAESRLDIAAQRHQAQALASRYGLVRRTRLVGGIEIGVEREKDFDGALHVGPSLSMELPLFNWGSGRAAAAQAALDRTEAELDALVLDRSNDVKLAHAQVASSKARAEAYRSALIPQREAVVEQMGLEVNYMLTSVFELLTARFWPQSINLRALWDTALADHPVIGDFEVDPYYVLQGISLASRKAPSCKHSDVLNLAAADITEWWDRVVLGLATGLEILRDDCKVMLPLWLPYQTMLPPLAAVLARSGNPKTAQAGAQREKLKRWFWCAVLGQGYESAANSKSAKDVAELVPWLAGGAAPESVETFRFDPRALRDVTPRQRAIYRGVINLVLCGGARDFHTQAVITGKLMAEQGIDDNHLFPAAHLERRGVAPARTRDCVLNRTLIDRTTNQMISDRAPSDYLAEIRGTPGFPFEAVLASHGLPAGADSALLKDDYEAFLTWRQDRLWREIQRVTGVTVAADLEADDKDSE